MRKLLVLGGLFLTLASCQVAEPRASLPPLLPDKVTAVPYGQLLTRARSQASRATEALYTDNFADVEEAARGLEQTAQYLVKAEDVPGKHKDTLTAMSGDLAKLAKELRETASAKNAEKGNEVLAKINAKVRSMRLSD
jgi:Skp family chaperone for outer membrane proteins